MRVEIRADFGEALQSVIETDQKVLVVIDWMIPKNIFPVPDDTTVFWVTTQPEGDYNQVIKDHPECYTHLLTMFPELLKLPNAHYFMGCTSFFSPNPFLAKTLGVSTVMSGRMNLPGHLLRREFFDRQAEVTVPLDFYLGTHNALPEALYERGIRLSAEKKDKIIAFNRMFHVTFGSYKRWGFFSEKLIDCFITMTVPIFWGCTNIGDYFNADGIIIVDSVDEAIDVCNSLTEEDWESRSAAMLDNYHRGLEYHSYEYQLDKTIKEILK